MTSHKSDTSKKQKTRSTVAKKSIRPFKQGAFDGCCSLYSLINAIRSTGFTLDQEQAQSLADAVFSGMKASVVKDLIQHGAGHKRLMRMFKSLNNALKEKFCHKITISRPFKTGKFNVKTVLKEMTNERETDGGIIVRMSCEDFDHYSVFDYADGERLRFIDSDHMPNMSVKDVSTNRKKDYKLHLKNVYFLRIKRAA